jgi:PST family polysaccharide transporter
MSGAKQMTSAKRSAGLLSISSVAGLFLPLVELPFLARALGIEQFGHLLFLQALALAAAVFVEYGYHFSGARRIGQAGDDVLARSRAISEVTTAKITLYCVVSLVTLVILFTASKGVGPTQIFYVLALVAAFGFSPMWYFLGRGRLVTPTLLDLALRGLGLLAIILVVKEPSDLDKALLIQAAVGILNTTIPSIIAMRENQIMRSRLGAVKASLVEGWTFFVYKSASGMSSSIATSVLGVTSGTTAVGTFSPSEKLTRAGTSFVTIVSSAFFSSAIANVESKHSGYRNRLFRALAMLFVILSLGASLIAFLAEPIVLIALGDEFVVGAHLLQLMVFVIPLRATGSVLSLLWLIPHKREKLVSRISLANIVFVLGAGLVVTPVAGAVGMGIVVAASEVCLFLVLCSVAGKIDA